MVSSVKHLLPTCVSGAIRGIREAMSMTAVIPADYPTELMEQALDIAAEGQPLRKVAEVLDCSTKHLFRLTERDAVFKQSLLQARIWGYYTIADEMLTIREDYKDVDPQFTRVIIEGKKWFLSKMYPAVFGDKLTIREEHVDLKGALTEARTRVITLVNPG